MDTDVAGRVARGVALLDARVPGWVDRVNTIKLDIQNCERCVLGQVYGDYFFGSSKLEIVERESEYGFDRVQDLDYIEDMIQDFEDLREEWQRVVTVLQAKPQVTVEPKELVNV